MDIDPDNYVEAIAHEIRNRHNIPISNQRLIYKNTVLKFNNMVKTYGISDHDTIDFAIFFVRNGNMVDL
jgi:hypothetical protein